MTSFVNKASASLAKRVKHAAMAGLLRRWTESSARQGGADLPSLGSLLPWDPAVADWVFTFDLISLDPPTLRRTHVGPALLALAELTAGMGTTFILGDQEDLFAGDLASYRRCLRYRQPVHEYMRVTTGTGQTTTMERLLLPCKDSTGGAHQLVGMVYFASGPDAPPAPSTLDTMTAAQIDALSFGVIKLDRDGRVERYSEVERQRSGYNLGSPVGLEFFTVVAPCMNTSRIRGRIQQAIHDGVFDAEFSHVGDFSDAEREMTIRAYSAKDGGVWITHTR